MAFADLLVLIIYFAAILGVGMWAGRRESSAHDYFLGGRRQPWIVVGLSILATELSAITFIGVPAKSFAGDCHYLQFYVGAFVGKMVVVWLLLPAFYRGNVTTIYEYLGQRFGPATRTTASILFFISRIIGSGLRLLAASIAISVVFGWNLHVVICIAAAVAMAYTTFGGIKAIIWTDALQALIFIAGAAGALIYLATSIPGGVDHAIETAQSAAKFNVFNFNTNLADDTNLLVIFVHTLFLNAAVFGGDQDMTHRMLTCRDIRSGQRSLTFNAVIGLPVVVLFLLVGVMIYAYDQYHATNIAGAVAKNDHIFPHVIANMIPSGWGLRGLLIAAVFAAAMSSLDSALGALSSTAVVDFYKPYVAADRSERHYLNVGRVFTFAFGVLLTIMAILLAGQDDLLYEAFEWASLIFGSLLGVLLLGVLTKRRGHDWLNVAAMLSAVGILVGFKIAQERDATVIIWPWWIVIGTGWTFAIGLLTTTRQRIGDPPAETVEQ